MNSEKWINDIPVSTAWYLTGFADGEGSFNLSLKHDSEYQVKWHIEPSFNVSQKDISILVLYKRYLGVGTIRQRKDGVYYYEVRNCNALYERVIPFFKKYSFYSATKKKNFSIFQMIVRLMYQKLHLTKDGLEKILKLREELNIGHGRNRKYSLDDYLSSQTESPETIRQIRRRAE